MELLREDEINDRMAKELEPSGWERRGNTIVRTFRCRDFTAAMVLVNRVADAAESANHHPDIDIRYNQVTFTVTTHSAGGLTEKDFALATGIDTLAAE